MKPVLIGCGVLVGVIVLLIVGIAGFGIFSVKQMRKDMAQTNEKIQATDKQFPFQAPADGQLSDAQLTRWIQARRQMVDGFKSQVENTRNMEKGKFKAMREAMNILPRMFEIQLRVLNESKMSHAEYTWISRQVLGALNNGDVRADPAYAKLVAAAEAPNVQTAPRGPRGPQGQASLASMAAPLTAKQALATAALLKKREAEVLEAMDNLSSDGMIVMMADSMSPQRARMNRGRNNQNNQNNMNLSAQTSPTMAAAQTSPTLTVATPMPAGPAH